MPRVRPGVQALQTKGDEQSFKSSHSVLAFTPRSPRGHTQCKLSGPLPELQAAKPASWCCDSQDGSSDEHGVGLEVAGAVHPITPPGSARPASRECSPLVKSDRVSVRFSSGLLRQVSAPVAVEWIDSSTKAARLNQRRMAASKRSKTWPPERPTTLGRGGLVASAHHEGPHTPVHSRGHDDKHRPYAYQSATHRRKRKNFYKSWRFLHKSSATSLSSMTSMLDSFRTSLGSTVVELVAWNDQVVCLFVDEGLPVSNEGLAGLLLATLALSMVLCMLLSDMVGLMVPIYAVLLQAQAYRLPLMAAAGLCAATFHLLDFYNWQCSMGLKAIGPSVAFYLAMASLLCWTKSYPEMPVVVAQLHIPLLFSALRLATSGQWASYFFHKALSTCSAAASAIVALAWLLWLMVGGRAWDDLSESRLRSDMDDIFKEYDLHGWYQCADERGKANPDLQTITSCAKVELCAFLAWTSPAIVAVVLGSIAGFMGLRAWHMVRVAQDHEDRTMQAILFITFVVVGIAWAACATAGSSMGLGNTVLLGLGGIVLVTGVWLLGTFRFAQVLKTYERSPMWALMKPVVKSDWVKALFVCCMNLFVIAFLAIEVLGRLVVRRPSPSRWTTKRGDWLVRSLKGWHWASVLEKAFILSVIYMMLWVYGTKFALVFLSWLNDFLQDFEVAIVIVVFYVVGLLLCLNPFVPVIPIYMAAGVIIVARIRHELEFVGGVAVAGTLCFILKLNAVVLQQKFIGEMLGRSITIQRLVGVQTLIVRAIETILLVNGITLAKVAVLCGGPDWPTSVLTGILRLSVWQMLLGTLPVVFLVLPSVLAGACLLDEELKSASPLVVAAMAVANGVAFISAMIFTVRVVTTEHKRLRKARDEHKELEESIKQHEMVAAQYRAWTQWANLLIMEKLSLPLAVAIELCTCWVTTFLSSSCFRPFSLNKRIADSYEEGGLNGQVLNVMKPLGLAATCLFLLGGALFVLYWVETGLRFRAARRRGDLDYAKEEFMRSAHESVASSADSSSRTPHQYQSGSVSSLPQTHTLSFSNYGRPHASRVSAGTLSSFAALSQSQGATTTSSSTVYGNIGSLNSVPRSHAGPGGVEATWKHDQPEVGRRYER